MRIPAEYSGTPRIPSRKQGRRRCPDLGRSELSGSRGQQTGYSPFGGHSVVDAERALSTVNTIQRGEQVLRSVQRLFLQSAMSRPAGSMLRSIPSRPSALVSRLRPPTQACVSQTRSRCLTTSTVSRGDTVKTFQHQSSLPRLPVPDLEKALEAYVKSLIPVMEQRVCPYYWGSIRAWLTGLS